MVDIVDKTLTFRHPRLTDNKGYPKTIRRGVGKIKDSGKLSDDLRALISLSPATQEELPKDRLYHPDALRFYFGALVAQDEKPETPEERQDRRWNRPGYGVDKNGAALRKKELEILELNAVIAGMQQNLMLRTQEQQALTMSDCWEHFKKVATCKSPEAKENLLRRVKHIVDGLGLNLPHCAVTKRRIEEVISEAKVSDSEKRMIRQESKRFFKELAYPVESDGLGLANPAVAIKIVGAKRLKVETTHPKELIKIGMPEYWNALVAVLGFAGLRLAEAAALTWDAIDWKAKILRVRISDVYPELKSAMSERDVKPFGNLWPILEAYQKTARHKKMVFDRPHKKAGPTWFRMYEEKPRAMDLSGQLKDEIKKVLKDEPDQLAKFHVQPALRLRHFWETEMRALGLEHLIEPMGGHESAVGLRHYTKFERVVEAATIPTI